jgi:hypothetical protein
LIRRSAATERRRRSNITRRTTPSHRRGLPKSVVAGDDLIDTFDCSLGPDTVLRNSPRNVQTRTTGPRHPFATITADRFRDDIDDNLVFSTDGHDAVATRYVTASVFRMRLGGGSHCR